MRLLSLFSRLCALAVVIAAVALPAAASADATNQAGTKSGYPYAHWSDGGGSVSMGAVTSDGARTAHSRLQHQLAATPHMTTGRPPPPARTSQEENASCLAHPGSH